MKDNGGTPTQGHVLTVDGSGEASFEAAGGFDQDSQGNLTAGTNAGDSFSGTNAEDNILIGENAGTAVSEGDNNIALGTDALKTVTLGFNNIAIGKEASKVQTHIPQSGGAFTFQGSNNVAIGTQALLNNTIGRDIVAVGSYALRSLTENSGYHTAIGNKALYNLDGANNQSNTAVGDHAAFSQTTASNNTILGRGAGYDITTGGNNVVIGKDAANSGTNDLTTGYNNIVIGASAAASSATQAAASASQAAASAVTASNSASTAQNLARTSIFVGFQRLSSGMLRMVYNNANDPNTTIYRAEDFIQNGVSHAYFLGEDILSTTSPNAPKFTLAPNTGTNIAYGLGGHLVLDI